MGRQSLAGGIKKTNLTCISVDTEKKLEYSERTHADTEKYPKMQTLNSKDINNPVDFIHRIFPIC